MAFRTEASAGMRSSMADVSASGRKAGRSEAGNEAAPASNAATANRSYAVVNTTLGAREVKDSYSLRRQTLLMNIPYFTTIAAALAACDAIEVARGDGGVRVRSLQEWGAES